MYRLSEQQRHPHPPTGSARERWVDLYGELIGSQLEADRRYSLISVGSVQFAYSDTDLYLRALGQAWDSGFICDPMPSALGRELPDVAPNLRGVDCELKDLEPADVESPRGRFS